MYKNVLKVLLCVGLVYVLDYLVGAGLRYLYFKPKEGKYYNLTYTIDSTKANIVVIGSSRASHSYVSQDIEDSLHLSCYNAGMEGAQFLHQYATIQSITKRYHPKIIIWDYWKGFEKNDLYYMEIGTLSPFYHSHPEIKALIDTTRPNEKYKLLSHIYPFNSTLFYNLNKSFSVYKSSEKDPSVKGWIPLHKLWEDKLQVAEYSGKVLPVDSNCISFYRSTIRYCKKNNIRLYIVASPYYGTYQKPANFDVLAQRIAREEGAPFFNYLNDSTLLSSGKYFSDVKHLNEEGAHLFTAKLVKAIQASKLSK